MAEGLITNRIELIHMVTNLIQDSEITEIRDRDDANMLAVKIVDGLQDEAARRAPREIAVSCDPPALTCPECGTSQAPYSSEIDHLVPVRCGDCGHTGNMREFREETKTIEAALERICGADDIKEGRK